MSDNTVNLNYISKRRKELGFTQSVMAAKLGMKSAPAYNKYEKGIYKFNADIIPLLVKTLRCEMSDIFCLQN